MITLYAKQKKRHRCTEQILDSVGEGKGGMFWKNSMYIIYSETDHQRGRLEGGSGWGIHVTPWLIHVNVWQNPQKCCEVISLQLIKKKKKKELAGSPRTPQICHSKVKTWDEYLTLQSWFYFWTHHPGKWHDHSPCNPNWTLAGTWAPFSLSSLCKTQRFVWIFPSSSITSSLNLSRPRHMSPLVFMSRDILYDIIARTTFQN